MLAKGGLRRGRRRKWGGCGEGDDGDNGDDVVSGAGAK